MNPDYDSIAHDVVISGDTLAISGYGNFAGGATLIFDRSPSDPSGWKEVRRLDRLRYVALDGDTLTGENDHRLAIHERNERGTNRWGRSRLIKPSDHFVTEARFLGTTAIRGNTLVGDWHFEKPDGSVGAAILVFERHARGKNQWGSVERLIDRWCTYVALGPREVVSRACEWDTPFFTCTDSVHHRPPILADDFENTNLSLWHQKKRSVAVVQPGLGGSEHALEVTLDGKRKKSFVRSRHPVRERNFSLSFLFLANEVDLGDRTIEILRLSGGSKNVRLTLEERGGGYVLSLWAAHNKGAMVLIGTTDVPARREVQLGLKWERATGPGHKNGMVRLLKNNRVVAEATDMDTDRLTISDVRLGLPSGCKGTGGGSFLVDLYDSNR